MFVAISLHVAIVGGIQKHSVFVPLHLEMANKSLMLLAYVKSTATQNTHFVGTFFKSWKIKNLKRPSEIKSNYRNDVIRSRTQIEAAPNGNYIAIEAALE